MIFVGNRRGDDRMTTRTAGTTSMVKPLPSEIDVFGLTHPGLVRQANADHFLVANFQRAMRVHASSLGGGELPTLSTDSRGYIMLVADGVGGLKHAKDGSAHATDAVARYFLDMTEISLEHQPEREDELIARLRTAVMQAHQALLGFAGHPGGATATTITVALAVWPRAFVVHAGDSRCYRFRDGTLEQLTTDQTMAQVMVSAGAMTRETADASRLKHVLVSALGSSQLDMQVVAMDLRRGDRFLLCSDGLTLHVTDADILRHLGSTASAETICHRLLDLALERGGEDNVTVIATRTRDG
jgi:PPM family protein phosphatase